MSEMVSNKAEQLLISEEGTAAPLASGTVRQKGADSGRWPLNENDTVDLLTAFE